MGAEFQARQTHNRFLIRRFIVSALTGSVAAYFIASILSNFHPQLYQFILISLASLLVCQTAAVALLEDGFKDALNLLRRDWDAALILALAAWLAVSALGIASQYPGLFHQEIFHMERGRLAVFTSLAIVLSACFGLFSNTKVASSLLEKIKSTSLFVRANENIPGLFLAAFFFLVYFTFAETINFPGFRTLDLYFDFDISTWLSRLTEPSVQDIPGIRPVHPAILLFLRPLVWLLSLFLNGDRTHALFILHALTGASCVLMIWLIVKQMTNQTAFSLLTASLLGTSASHLLLSSMLETYIYSAFGLILFTLFMRNGKTSLRNTLPAGVLISGITISNFAQTCILYLATRPPIKSVVKYILLILLSLFVMNTAQARLYPTAEALFEPSSLDREQNYRFNPLNAPAWRTRGRVYLTARAVTLYGIVAPTPFILDEELGWKGIPHFRTFKLTVGQFHVAGYSGLADVTAKLWIFLLMVALVIFILDFIKSPTSSMFSIGLLLCLGFNFILHTLYGDDPMLYSPDWVFAIVLFVAHSFKRFAERKWIRLILFAFLGLTMIVNLDLIRQIMQVSAPLYGR